jgi:hypothetical protein
MKGLIALFICPLFFSLYNCNNNQQTIIQQCGNSICSKEGGYCKEDQCICYPGYTTVLRRDHTSCNYKQISRFKAGLLEMFLGCGFGHFYANRKLNGTLKLSCVILFCGCCIFSFYMMRKIREESHAQDHPWASLIFLLSVVFKIVVVCWQILDGILFFCGIYKDGFDMPLV